MTRGDGFVQGKETVKDSNVSFPWTMVILSEGYTSNEIQLFRNQVGTFVNRFIGSSPFFIYFEAIRIIRIDVVSNESGIDNPKDCSPEPPLPADINVKTFFDASLCGDLDGVRRYIDLDKALVDQVISQELDNMPINCKLVFVNSTEFGGSDDEGAVSPANPVGVFCIPGPFGLDTAAAMAIHEIGHAGFNLADEYAYNHACPNDLSQPTQDGPENQVYPFGEPSEPNVTTTSDPTTVKWRDLILPTTITQVDIMINPDPTKCDERPAPATTLHHSMQGAGLFEGANHFRKNIFRSQFNCKMSDYNEEFCVVCKKSINQKMWIHYFNDRKLLWGFVQHILKNLSFYSGAIDGMPGSPNPVPLIGNDIEGLKNFQVSKGLSPSGLVDVDTWSALCQSLIDVIDVSAGPIKYGDEDSVGSGFIVYLVQEILMILISPNGTPPNPSTIVGTPPGLLDALFGPLTYSAVRLFQRQSGGLTEDGKVGPNTLAAMISSLKMSFNLLSDHLQ